MITSIACLSSPSNFFCFSLKSTSTFFPRDIGGGDVTWFEEPLPLGWDLSLDESCNRRDIGNITYSAVQQDIVVHVRGEFMNINHCNRHLERYPTLKNSGRDWSEKRSTENHTHLSHHQNKAFLIPPPLTAPQQKNTYWTPYRTGFTVKWNSNFNCLCCNF